MAGRARGAWRHAPQKDARRKTKKKSTPAVLITVGHRQYEGVTTKEERSPRMPNRESTPAGTIGGAGGVAPPGWGWCWEPPAGAGRAWPARGKRRGGRPGRHTPAGGVAAPPGQLSGARAPGPRANGYQGVAGRGGYVARARRRVATPGADTSGRGARSRFPLVSTYRIGGLVLHCT